jgi:hypothetical protein
MIRITTYQCGPAERAFVKERLDQAALKGRIEEKDIEIITNEINRLLGVVVTEVTQSCQTRKA